MDCVVTVPMRAWFDWIEEGCLPPDSGDLDYPEAHGVEYHFWLAGPLPEMAPGDRVYVVAHGRLRGYAPLEWIERRCRLRPSVGCLVRTVGAVAVTIDRPIRGFRGWQYRDWDRAEERPFPDWMTDGTPADVAERLALAKAGV